MAERIGVWVIGAWGGVATTTAVGLAALRQGLTSEVGLVSALPAFKSLELAGWDDFVVGGHEIRETSYAAEARQLNQLSGVLDRDLLAGVATLLEEFDRNVRPGTLINVGPTIESFAGPAALGTRGESPAAAIERIKNDITQFKQREDCTRVIVVNLASTEPPPPALPSAATWSELSGMLAREAESPAPASTLYAVAAMQCGCPFVNFTPSVGSDLPALSELALDRQVVHVGRDGKTGETLMKSVLAPMFANRNLKVLSWVGHNIFGNLDGKVLDDPVNKANKVKSKDHLLTEILGYKPQTLVSIEYIESMADWKTAWDHIHFQGFLGTKMSLQFIWQGCDSLLAAPLAIDLVRLTEREARRGGSGVMSHLACFFKSPMGCDEPAFALQHQALLEWAAAVAAEGT